MYNKPMDSA